MTKIKLKLSECNIGERNPMYRKSPYKNKTEEEIKLIKEKISKSCKGKSIPQEVKDKISKTRKEKSHLYPSMKSSNNPRAIKVKVYYQDKLFGEYDCTKDASRAVEQWFLENKNIKCC